MSDTLSESAIVCLVAQNAARHISRKVIAELQRMNHTMSGDDTELKTTWDEICVQVQGEKSFYWDAYHETARNIAIYLVDALPKHELEAMWLQCPSGFDWRHDDPECREPYPVFNDDVVEHLLSKYVYHEADRWSNTRIREYLTRSSRRD
jgi:hypothetical protein